MKKPGSTRKLKGGKYIAKGTYGCVFKDPPLKCKNESTRRGKNYITKLMKDSDANEEDEQSKLIRHFDPTEKYFVTAEKVCEIDAANIKPKNNIKKCTLKVVETATKRSNYSDTRLLLSKDGGSDISLLHLKAVDYIPFYESIQNLFTGLDFFHSKGIIHHDIKSDNIITLKQDDGKFLTRFIDVGFVCTFTPVEGLTTEYNKYKVCNHFSIFRNKARAYGPFYEYFFYENTSVKEAPRLEQAIKSGVSYESVYTKWVKDISEYLRSNDPFLDDDDKSPLIAYSTVIDDLKQIWNGREAQQFTVNDIGADFVIKLTTKADIFSFGLFLSKLQKRFLSHVVKRKNGNLNVFILRSEKLKNAGATQLEIPVENLASLGLPANVVQWHLDVAQNITIPLHKLMTQMSTLDPSKSISLTEALSKYKDICATIRDLYKSDLVYAGLKAIDEYPELGNSVKESTPTKKLDLSSSNSKSSSVKAKVKVKVVEESTEGLILKSSSSPKEKKKAKVTKVAKATKKAVKPKAAKITKKGKKTKNEEKKSTSESDMILKSSSNKSQVFSDRFMKIIQKKKDAIQALKKSLEKEKNSNARDEKQEKLQEAENDLKEYIAELQSS